MSTEELFKAVYHKSNELADLTAEAFCRNKINIVEIRRINIVLSLASAAGRELENILRQQEHEQ